MLKELNKELQQSEVRFLCLPPGGSCIAAVLFVCWLLLQRRPTVPLLLYVFGVRRFFHSTALAIKAPLPLLILVLCSLRHTVPSFALGTRNTFEMPSKILRGCTQADSTETAGSSNRSSRLRPRQAGGRGRTPTTRHNGMFSLVFVAFSFAPCRML